MMNRRTFMRSAALASLSMAPLIQVMGKDQLYKTALIGSGWWGMNILRCALRAGQS